MKELRENLAKINDKTEFQQLFLLFVVSVMLRQTKQYVVDKRFYGAASVIEDVKKMDWCQCIYNTLMGYIRKYRICAKNTGGEVWVGGFVYILAVCVSNLVFV